MKILIITQKVDKDDSYFGFFHGWLKKFSLTFDKVTVACLELRSYDLPPNVEVLSLGKEKGRSTLKYVFRLLKYSWQNRNKYDFVFAHMSPLYVIVGAPLWKLLRKPVGLWYVHRNADLKLKIATFLTDIVFTATKESFNVRSKKINYMGQAVDLDLFKPTELRVSPTNCFEIITVGRITPIKNIHILIEALSLLKKQNIIFHLNIVGDPVTDGDNQYKKKLISQIKDLGLENEILFAGAIKNVDMPVWYSKSDLSINLCPTGGLDKAVLESMASKVSVLVSNRAFESYFGEYKNVCIFNEGSVDSCFEKILKILKLDQEKKNNITDFVFQKVNEKSSLTSLIINIKKIFISHLNK